MRRSVVALCCLLFVSLTACARDSGQAVNINRRGRALKGHDVVAYYILPVDADAVAGTSDYAYEWRGAVWWFSSEKNLNAFREDPEAYAPQYGNYCSMAMALDQLADSDPDAWVIREGELFLFAQKKGRTRWRGDPEANIEYADGYWPAHRQKLISDGAK